MVHYKPRNYNLQIIPDLSVLVVLSMLHCMSPTLYLWPGHHHMQKISWKEQTTFHSQIKLLYSCKFCILEGERDVVMVKQYLQQHWKGSILLQSELNTILIKKYKINMSIFGEYF